MIIEHQNYFEMAIFYIFKMKIICLKEGGVLPFEARLIYYNNSKEKEKINKKIFFK